MLIFLLACQAPISDYELTIVPVLLESQADEILAAQPDIEVRLVYPDAEPEVFYAGIAASGQALTIEELPPIPADTLVQLIAEDPGGPTGEWTLAATLAYGEGLVTEELATGGSNVELVIEMARTDSVGKLAALRASARRVDSAVAVVDGAAYVFGGGDPETEERFSSSVGALPLISSGKVLKSTHTTEGWSGFDDVGAIPMFQAPLGFPGTPAMVDADRRSGMTATPVEVDGRTLILVVGGRYTDFPAWVIDEWFLWDPSQDAVSSTGVLTSIRADHLALRVGNNRVLLYGGISDFVDGTPYYEIWKAASFDSDPASHTVTMRTGGVAAAGAELGEDAVICGGFTSDRDSQRVLWTPSSACHRITGSDSLFDLADLPIPIGAGALAALPDGGLLLTGGISTTIREDVIDDAQIIGSATIEPALDRAFRWYPDDDRWEEFTMVHGRAHHASIALPTGKVLIVGGTETGTSFYGEIDGPIRCAELFDPDTNTFTEVGCSEAGQGAVPKVAVGGNTEDTFVLEGSWYSGVGQRTGGGTYGIVRGIPE